MTAPRQPERSSEEPLSATTTRRRFSRRGRPDATGHTLDDLRPLLVGPEQDRLARLEQKLASPEALAEAVGSILPRAAVISRSRGEELASALKPVIVSTIHDAFRGDPGTFADAIYPSMGPAIRTAVRVALEALVRRLDETIQRTMTIESLRWRIESARTGRPFTEVVLRHSLVYRVEHIFLMHRETGLVLQHVVADDVRSEDPDQVSAMLKAIDDFARDAFREKDGGLTNFQVGELAGWIEHGPRAVLVAIVRGVAPSDMRMMLAGALERIHLQYAELLEKFRGDTAAFAGARAELVPCMREQRRQRHKPARAVAFAVAVAAAIALVIGVPLYRRHERMAGYIDALRREPGLMVTETRGSGRRVIEGLRDPLAADPAAMLAAHGLPPRRVELRFSPFYSLDPLLVERRAVLALGPPPGASLRLEGGTLVAEGSAPRAWIERARLLVTALPGITALDDSRLHDEDASASAHAAAAALEATAILFTRGSARVPASERRRLEAAAQAARDLISLAPRAGLEAHIEITGHADPTGSPEHNLELGQARAAGVAAELRELGVPPESLVARSAGEAGMSTRRVTFAVRLDPRSPSGDSP